jgi:hypothetical protein
MKKVAIFAIHLVIIVLFGRPQLDHNCSRTAEQKLTNGPGDASEELQNDREQEPEC